MCTLRPSTIARLSNINICCRCSRCAVISGGLLAIWRNAETGALEVKPDRCIQCNACVPACPFGNLQVEAPRPAVVKCDLCGGDPACAQFCPTKALEYLES